MSASLEGWGLDADPCVLSAIANVFTIVGGRDENRKRRTLIQHAHTKKGSLRVRTAREAQSRDRVSSRWWLSWDPSNLDPNRLRLLSF